MDLRFTYAGRPGLDTDDEFDTFSEQVLDALRDLEKADSGLHDPDITATLARRQIVITMAVDADTLPDALRIFSANVRTAQHVAGCGTSDWPVIRPAGKDGLPPARLADFADA